MLLSFIFTISLSTATFCQPLPKEDPNGEFQKNSERLEGDIMVNSRLRNRGKRQATIWKGLLWPNATVPYLFGKVTPQQRYMFKRAMKHISSSTCVKFEERKADEMVYLEGGNECYGWVGNQGEPTIVSIGTGCGNMGNAVHEFSHTLGLIHTQSRTDRDKYITVNRGDPTNYGMWNDTYNVIPYEYGSVMTYGANSVVQPKDPKWLGTMGNRIVTFYDMAAIVRLYDCKCSKDLDCKNGGYTNPSNCSECYCPLGFGGILCDRAPRTFSKTLNATEEWKEHSMNFGFDGLTDTVSMRATLFVTAPKDKTIQVQVSYIYNFACTERCVWNAFEIKYMGDPRVMNPLFCCKDVTGWNDIYTSKLNPTPINIYNRYRAISLTLRYRYINGSVEDLPKTNNTFDSYQYPVYDY